MSEGTAVRYPQYVTDYLFTFHDFRWPQVDDGLHRLIAVLDHLFELAIEAHRLRKRVAGEVEHMHQELEWVEKSLAHGCNARRVNPGVYETRNEGDPHALGRTTRALNVLEDQINKLCRAVEKMAKA